MLGSLQELFTGVSSGRGARGALRVEEQGVYNTAVSFGTAATALGIAQILGPGPFASTRWSALVVAVVIVAGFALTGLVVRVRHGHGQPHR